MPGLNIPGFPTSASRGHAATVPHSHECGDVPVPWNVGIPVFRFRAPCVMSLSSPTIYCREVVSPSGNPVILEVWKNGEFCGEMELKHGPTQFDKSMALAPLDLIELRMVIRGSGFGETFANDLWVMFTT